MLSVFESPAAPPPPDAFNLAAYVLAQADHVPDKTALAIVSASRANRWRYGAVAQAVAGIAGGLLAQGRSPGDRVLLRLGNTAAFPFAYLGAIWAGLIPVPTSSGLTEEEITAISAQLRPGLILAGDGIALPRGSDARVLEETDVMGLADHSPVAPVLGDPERPAYIIFTSGTSGQPRGVVHAHRAIWARRMMWDGWYGLTAQDRLMHAGAFNWTYTLGTGLMDPWTMGATALIPAPGLSSTQLPLLAERHQATIFAAAPGVYRQMLRAKLPPMPKLRHGLSAGEALPPALRNQWQQATGTDLHEALGLSECSTFVSGAPGAPAPAGTSGRPQLGRTIAVLDSDGSPVPRGAPGVLSIHRSDPGLMLGYLDAEAETNSRYAGDWFQTGDTVALSEQDHITYLGRSDDMINAGGFRVSPLEVEGQALSFAGLRAAAAVEREVRRDVTVLALHYVGDQIDEAALEAHLATRLAPYKRPRMLIREDALPLAGNGKINRKALRRRPAARP